MLEQLELFELFRLGSLLPPLHNALAYGYTDANGTADCTQANRCVLNNRSHSIIHLLRALVLLYVVCLLNLIFSPPFQLIVAFYRLILFIAAELLAHFFDPLATISQTSVYQICRQGLVVLWYA